MAFDLNKWRNGADGFFAFLEDVKPQVRGHEGRYVPFMPVGETRDEIRRALDGDHSVIVLCWPRRHGKTLSTAMILLWRFLTKPNENIAVVANSERQSVDVAFRTIREAFGSTPFLKSLVDSRRSKVGADKIEYPATGSVIAAFPSNASALWGKKLSAAQISELHAARSDDVMEALSGSLLDTRGSVLLIDSTVGARSSPLFGLYSTHQRGDDEKLFFSHIEYRDLEDACANSPEWIGQAELRSLSKRMLPTKFALMHLNRWGDASAALFTKELIDTCRNSYGLSLDDVTKSSTLPHIVGAGLDRAFGFSVHGDNTITACVAKVSIDEDDHYFVLACDPIRFSRLSGIKSTLTDYHRKFKASKFFIESYNSQDVGDWLDTTKFGKIEVAHVSRRLKNSAFTMLYSAAAEGRLHIDESFAELFTELETFEVHHDNKVNDGEAALPKFQHAKGCKDDRVHALAWAVYSLRDVELVPYELHGIECNGRGPAVTHCALNGGAQIPACGESCRSMLAAHRLYQAYKSRRQLFPMSFEEFVTTKLKNTGAHSLPR